MTTSEREVFTFTWRIVNFSFCPQKIGKRIESPIFVVDFLQKSEWRLLLYPRGVDKQSENRVHLYLKRSGNYSGAIAYSFALCSATGKDIKSAIEHDNGCFIRREVIFHTTNGYLSNDTLTVKCELRKAIDPTVSKFVDSDLFNRRNTSVTVDRLSNLRTRFGFNQCTAITRIEVGHKSITLPISGFSKLCPKEELYLSVRSLKDIAPSFSLTLYISDDNDAEQNAHIEIRANSIGKMEHYYVKCKMVAFNVMNKERCEKEDEHHFDSEDGNDVWKFPTFIDVKKFKKGSCCNSSQDTLYLRCEFAFTRPENVCHMEKTDSVPFSNETLSFSNNSIGPMFKQLYNTDKFSDVIIRTGNHEFKAHKIVLSQSAVFSAMFENDMAEKQSGIVVIKDIEKRILDMTLSFMYGEDLKITSVEDAEKLYFAADRYEILPLRWACLCFLKTNLSVKNMYSVLSLADLHQDQELMAEVKRFIRLHASEIFHSLTWAELMKSNCQLAADIMLNELKNLYL